MAIDPRIALGVQPFQLPAPPKDERLNMLAQVMQIRDAESAHKLNTLKIDEYQRGIEDQNALRTALSAPDADPYKVLLQRGKVKEAGDFQKSQNEAEKAKREAAKMDLEMGIKKAEHVASVLSLAKDPQSYAQVRQVIAQNYGMNLPEQFDPGFIQANIAQGQTLTQRLQAEHQRLTLAETGRHNRATEGLTARGQDITVRGQNMTDARAREGNNIQREAARTQVIETPQGVMLVDKGTGQARHATVNGQPMPGKPSAAVEKELVGLRQQTAIVDGALAAIDKTPTAFGLTRGMATMAGAIPESLAGRMDSDAERQARSYVFNNVSKVINERAGAAQSAQELARLRSFLPAETDNADQIKSKLSAFKTYLSDMEAGTKGQKAPSAGGASGGWSIQRVK